MNENPLTPPEAGCIASISGTQARQHAPAPTNLRPRMGMLRELGSERTRPLHAENLVGRGALCELRLDFRYVSAQHALIRWTGAHWLLKDLGSRNGTYLDGVRVRQGEACPLRRGAKISFGHASKCAWELQDESPPAAMVVPLGGGEPIVMEHDLLALPSTEEPLATIYRDLDAQWVLEGPDASIVMLSHLQTFRVGRQLWKFCSAERPGTTSLATSIPGRELRRLSLQFSVSQDEEHVALRMICDGTTTDLGTRKHHYLLLTLARQRLRDAAEGHADSACGWIDQEVLGRDPSMAPPQLNIDVFRIRRQFAALGVIDAANVIERRLGAKQLRLGAAGISITRV